MKKFKDLKFEKHPNYSPNGFKTSSKMFFSNGYGVSVITGGYGNEQSPYELAVLYGTDDNYSLTYSTDVTGDVEGYLTESEVSELMIKVQKLKKD